MSQPTTSAQLNRASSQEKNLELHDIDPHSEEMVEEYSYSEASERRPQKPKKSLSQRWLQTQFILRMLVLGVTVTTCLYIMLVQVLNIIFGAPDARDTTAYLDGYPQMIAYYVMCVLTIALSAVVIVFELDFGIFRLIYKQIKLLQYYCARGVVQFFLAAMLYSQIIGHKQWLWVMKELGAYAMLAVAVFHLVFGITCLDRILLGLRKGKHDQFTNYGSNRNSMSSRA